jgi:general stress protein 26
VAHPLSIYKHKTGEILLLPLQLSRLSLKTNELKLLTSTLKTTTFSILWILTPHAILIKDVTKKHKVSFAWQGNNQNRHLSLRGQKESVEKAKKEIIQALKDLTNSILTSSLNPRLYLIRFMPKH